MWVNPFTGEHNTSSFDDIFENTLAEANVLIPSFIEGLNFEDTCEMTKHLNFSGKID